MSDLEILIETTNKLSNTLSQMASNELKFGWDLGQRLEDLSYEMFKATNELKVINSYLIGGCA